MWLIIGPFDSADVSTTKTKLLKTGRKIPLGRKDKPLVVNSKKISREQCEFTVGPYTQDDVENPSFVPALEIFNAKDKPMTIEREDQPVVVNPSTSCELKSGDKITIVAGICIEVQWRRITCFLPPARSLPSISREDCAALGISLITSPNSLATHHLTAKYELTVPLATSLLSATQLVKVEWLQELLRLGTAPDESHPFKLATLEQTFVPPLESKYRPAFSPSLPASFKSFKFWEPSEERLHLFKGYRFVLLSDAAGEADSGTRELVIRGEGEYECFPVMHGEAKWRQLLGKALRKVDEAGLKVVIVAKEHVQVTVGEDRWRQMTSEAQSHSLPLINVDVLMNAVIHSDASLINDTSSTQGPAPENESPLPDFVPNTHPSEPSLPKEPEEPPAETVDVPRKPHSPSPPPTGMLFGLAIPPPPNQSLLHRSRPPSTTSRVEAPAVSNVKEETQATSLGYGLPPLPEMTRSSKLRRRTPAPETPTAKRVAVMEPGEEPPLKKFKALFDASDPDKMVIDNQDIEMGRSVGETQDAETQTQTQSKAPHSQIAVPPRTLAVVEEEEEESGETQVRQTAPAAPRSRRKTPLPQATQGLEADATQVPGTSRKPPSKQGKPKATRSHGLDTDPAFLTAIASKKGKKKSGEDEFDREFNNLRISKPDIRRDEEEQAWEVFGDFDSEPRNLRGNFMVVIDLDVPLRKSGQVVVTHTYDGRPNFKKFKKTPTPASRVPIELVARTEDDYGVGTGYWKDSGALDDQETFAPIQTPGTQKRRAPAVLESDGADSDVPPAKPTKKVARKPPQSKASAAAKLFLDSDEENATPEGDSQARVEKAKVTKKAPEPILPAKGSKRRHIIVDDDSDDGVAFKGFAKKRKIR